MRTARSAVLALLLVTGACGSDPETSNDGGRDGGAGSGGRGGTNATAGRGGTGGTAGAAGGTAGAAGGAAGAGATGGAAGAAGGAAGAGATGGAAGGTAGAAGGAAGAAGGTAGVAGGAAGAAGGAAGAAGGAAGAAGGVAGAAGGAAGAAGGAAGAVGGAAGAAGGAAGAAGGAAGAAGGAAGVAGAAGNGGGGGIACTTATTCPGTDDDCQQRVCMAGFCTTSFTATNTALAVQTPGDCKRTVCDGLGGVLSQILDSDTPADDTNVCTGEICMNGIPSHPPLQAGTVCTQSGGRLCNGSSAAPACVGCLAVANCPGTDTICQQRACQDNACVAVNAPAGTAAEADAPGNCHKNVCGNTGNVVSQIDNADTPAEDGNQCTLATCNAGTPAQQPVTAGAVCNQNNGRVCSGTACVECIAASNCPGTDSICQQRTCSAGNTCGTTNAQAGIDAEPDAVGNCHKAVCNGNGGVASQIDDNDKPAADTNQCTTATCTAGVPSQAPVTPGTTCAQSGGKVCSGTACVECIVANDCTGTDTACQQRTCSASNTCGTAFTQAGTAAEPDAAGNCHKAICDGSGGVDSVVDDTDKPGDNNACTNDVCTAGVVSNPPLPAGTICNADNIHVCNSAAACNLLTFRVVRVGDGSAALTNGSTATFIEERQLDGTPVGTPLALPIAASGANVPLTLSGTATSDGALALSGDGHYLTLAGYAAVPGTASVVGIAATTINRVVARIDVAGAIDTTTRFNFAFSADNVRSAASADGTGFWIGGNGTSTTRGVWYNPLGSVGGEVRIITVPGNTRWVQVVNGQLYVTGNGNSQVGVNTVGTGLPTTTGQTAALLPGLVSGGSPFGFVLLDLNPAVVGVDTLYVADDGATAGIAKYTFNGTTWASAGTLNTSAPTGFRGLAGYAVSGTVTLIASTNASQNELVVFVDNGTTVTATALTPAAALNTVYRGVALSPHFQP